MDENLQYNNADTPLSEAQSTGQPDSIADASGDVVLSSERTENAREFNYTTIRREAVSSQPTEPKQTVSEIYPNANHGTVPSNQTIYPNAQTASNTAHQNSEYNYPVNNQQPFAQRYPQGGYQNQTGRYPNVTQGYPYPPAQNQYGYTPKPSYAGTPNNYQPYYYQPSPKELEKKALKKDASICGALTVTIFITMIVFAFIIEIVGFFCGIVERMPDVSDPYVGFTPAGFYLYEGLLSLLSIFIPTLIIAKISKNKLSELIPFKKVEGKKLAAIVFSGLSLCMVAQIVSAMLGINLGLFGIDIYEGMESNTATGVFDIIMNSICTAVIPALVEEFAYRGLVVGLFKKHDEMLAVFASAFLFGMLHGNLVQIPFAFIVGLVLGYVRVKTDSMLPGILIHFGNNFYAVIVTTIGELVPDAYSIPIEYGVLLLLIVIGFVASYYLTKNHKELFEIKKKESYLTGGEKLKTFFSSATVIASTIILCIMSFAVLKLL